MSPRLPHRAGHYALLVLAWATLCLPNLGRPSLWDIDEGNNSEASLEMKESGNYVKPTFNYQLREDKPALLYWLQAAAYGACGVNEFAARLPSALAALVTVLATYELGRRLFGKGAGLLAGLVLTSAVLFCGSAHFANPDALLNAFTALTLALVWYDYTRGPTWWVLLTGVTTGLAVLAKGPVGVLLPWAVTWLFFLWRRHWRRLADPRLLLVLLVFLVVAAPWYVWVGTETKWHWLAAFWKKHNQDRFLHALEGHGGPFFYYALVLVAGLAPWSAFLGLAGWHALKHWRAEGADPCLGPVQFLLCWVAVYFLFFSVAGTKLPNYILPLYPAGAVLLGWFLDRWRRGLVQPPAWAVRASLVSLALMGLGVGLGLLVIGGSLPVPCLEGRRLPGLERWAALGLVLPAGAAVAGWCVRHQRRAGAVAALAASAVVFVGTLAAWGGSTVERYKAPRALVGALPPDQTRRDVRVAAYAYFQPSLVFYCQREVFRLSEEKEALEFLAGPLPSYLFLPARYWEGLRKKVTGPHRVLARRHDLYDGCDVVVVTNEEK
jgi:4-amino-4-deoxy-L-arabinose transferase-like glycosyltransferase